MDKFTNKILKYIRKNNLIRTEDKIVVGFSGGADSVSLLLMLNSLKRLLRIELLAVHVHHGIRGDEADRDEEFCRLLAEGNGISYKSVHVDAPLYAREHGLTEEEAGRLLRYERLRETGKDFFSSGDVLIAVAHHADDQAETILFNMLRGSGLKGLGGMQPRRDDIIRPLLCVTKQEILSWLEQKNAGYVTDSTNLENDHTRNFIRNAIMPELKSNVNEGAAEHICAAGLDAYAADEFIRDEAKKYLTELGETAVRRPDGSIALKLGQSLLKEKAQIFRIYVIIEGLRQLQVPLKDWGSRHFQDIDKMLFMGKGAHTDLPGGICAENEYRETFIIRR